MIDLHADRAFSFGTSDGVAGGRGKSLFCLEVFDYCMSLSLFRRASRLEF